MIAASLSDVLSKRAGLKPTGMDVTHTGTVLRDSSGAAQHTGFTVFTPEHDRIMQIYQVHSVADGSKSWSEMCAALPEYMLSASVLSRLSPATARAFAWNVTEGKYFDAKSGGEAPTQLANDMENKDSR
jgi:hypothetical protein